MTQDAFWMLVALMDDYVPGYHTETLLKLRVDVAVFEALARKSHPRLFKRLVHVSHLDGRDAVRISHTVVPHHLRHVPHSANSSPRLGHAFVGRPQSALPRRPRDARHAQNRLESM